MLIRVGYEMTFDFPDPTPMLMLLYVLPSRAGDLRQPDTITLQPNIPIEEFIDCFGNRCARILAPAGRLIVRNDTVVEDSGLPPPIPYAAVQHPVEVLPTETLQYLLSSRYCEVDKLTDIAWKLFGDIPPGTDRVLAICTWVHGHIEFGYQYASPTKSAYDVYLERKGVCRDFTHLAITMCRAMSIPARYCTGYLGDIGIPLSDSPMDFSACFQVYLGGEWQLFDARHNARRIGWILMATGRDATDCAITTTFGPHILDKFVVWSDEVKSAELVEARG